MFSVSASLLLLAASAAAPVQLHLPEQSLVPGAVYPHPACVCLPEGWGKDAFSLEEDGKPVESQAHVRARWSDGSAKWLHVYAPFRYQSGKPARYVLAPVDGSSEAVSRRTPADIKAFAPELYCTDDLGRQYKAGSVKTEKLDDGPVATVWHLSGEMLATRDTGDRLMKVLPFLTFHTWVTIYQSRIDVEHAYTVASDMRGVRISELGLKLTAAPGWVGVLRDEGRRAPHKLVQTAQAVDVVLWPKGGVRRTAVSPQSLHAFPWLHSGEVLDFPAPENVHQLAKSLQSAAEAPYRNAQGVVSPAFERSGAEWSETRAENLRTSTPEGISIVCNFSLVKLSEDRSVGSVAEQTVAWRKLIDQKPVARPTSQWIAESQALGSIAPRSKKYESFEKQIDQAHYSFHDPEKTGTYGWANYGNSPERIAPAKAVAGTTSTGARGRVIQHRACSYNHYWIHPKWIHVFRGGPQEILDTARRTTAYLAAFGQCRHTTLRKDGLPVTRGKILWGFYHSVNFYPWGTTDYGLNWPDVECALVGHWVDPYALQLAWLHDCNWFAKSGYDGWAQAVPIEMLSLGREFNSTLAQWVFAHRYFAGMPGQQALAKKFLEGARRASTILISVPLAQQVKNGSIGVLWYPTWPLLADEVLDSDASRKYIVESAAYLARHGGDGITPSAVIARAVELGADRRLLDHVKSPKLTPPAANSTVQFGPGALGEGHHAIAWPVTLKILQRLEKE